MKGETFTGRIAAAAPFIMAVVFFVLNITSLISNFSFMQGTLHPLQGGIILLQDGTNITRTDKAATSEVISTTICYPPRFNSFANQVNNIYFLYLVFFIAGVILFVSMLYKSFVAVFRGFKVAFPGEYIGLKQGLPLYSKGLILILRLLTGKSDWLDFDNSETSAVVSYDNASSYYTAYVSTLVPLFCMAWYLLSCGPSRLLGNTSSLLSYILSVILFIQKVPTLLVAMGFSGRLRASSLCQLSVIQLFILSVVVVMPLIVLAANIQVY